MHCITVTSLKQKRRIALEKYQLSHELSGMLPNSVTVQRYIHLNETNVKNGFRDKIPL